LFWQFPFFHTHFVSQQTLAHLPSWSGPGCRPVKLWPTFNW